MVRKQLRQERPEREELKAYHFFILLCQRIAEMKFILTRKINADSIKTVSLSCPSRNVDENHKGWFKQKIFLVASFDNSPALLTWDGEALSALTTYPFFLRGHVRLLVGWSVGPSVRS